MNQYVTGALIKKLREERRLTQAALAGKLTVSDKAVSRWETGRGYPDITLIEPLAQSLGISVAELLAGSSVENGNRAFNMLRVKLYVCPICGNVIVGTGGAAVSCCGLMLTPQEAEPADEAHTPLIEPIEDEYCVTLNHEMSRAHAVSFIMAVSDSGFELTKLYPEGDAQARFKISRTRMLYWYCNRHGLFVQRVTPPEPRRKRPDWL